MADTPGARCPVCKTPRLKPHCADKHPTCTWYRCKNPGCSVTVDIRRKRGLDQLGRRFTL